MRRAFADNSNTRLQLLSAAALARCGDPKATAFLRHQLKTGEPENARIAGWVLGRIGSVEDIPALQKRRDHSETALQRVFHQNSLVLLGDPAGLRGLADHLSSSDAATRTYGATYAGETRAIQTQSQLIRLLDDTVLDVRIRTAQSLLVLNTPPPAER